MDSVALFNFGGVKDTGWWAGREAARTPLRMRDRVVAQFLSQENRAYLRSLLASRVPAGKPRQHVVATLGDGMEEFATRRALEVLASDPISQRGALRPAVDFWGELRRLNRVFFEDRMAMMRENAAMIDAARGSKDSVPRDGVDDDNESYQMRMFISDSLRPPGLEHLNTPGALYDLREDQSTWVPRGAARGPREGFQPKRGTASPEADADDENDADDFVGDADAPWSRGHPNRTPEQAMAEYWGDSWAATETATGAPEQMGMAYGDETAWGSSWRENGGSRFMRYESVPFWQLGGREGYERDIDETLGTQSRELDNPVRRWDMDRVRAVRAQEYRRYGARSGHLV